MVSTLYYKWLSTN